MKEREELEKLKKGGAKTKKSIGATKIGTITDSFFSISKLRLIFKHLFNFANPSHSLTISIVDPLGASENSDSNSISDTKDSKERINNKIVMLQRVS